MSDSTFSAALQILQPSLPEDLQLKILGEGEVSWNETHALDPQLRSLKEGKPCSLPAIRPGKVAWVTFGGQQEHLLEAIEDLRSWILPYLGQEDASTSIVCVSQQSKPSERVFCSEAGWYFRWYCPTGKFSSVLKRLRTLTSLLDSRPDVRSSVPPSLNSLRLEFVVALRTGSWSAAKKAVDTVDQWELDSARNTELMRVRLRIEEGDAQGLVTEIRRSGLLDSPLPSRITGQVLDTVYREEIAPLEEAYSWQQVADFYARHWHTSLSPHIGVRRSTSPDFRLFAYHAYLDRDVAMLQGLLSSSNKDLARAMLEQLHVPLSPVEVEGSERENQQSDVQPLVGRAFWDEIESSVLGGNQGSAARCMEGLTEELLNDNEWVACGSDTLLELFTDPAVMADVKAKLIAEEVLCGMIDAIIGSDDFPRQRHAPIYTALLSCWVAVRGESAREQDGQLLLGLGGAAIEYSVGAVETCENAIRAWFNKRKTSARLPWLAAAIDMLVGAHPNPSALQDIWIEGADLILRQGIPLAKSERAMWKRLGRQVEFDDASIATMIIDLPATSQVEEVDPISLVGIGKIAIVTLQDRAARQAAEELVARTGAEVIVITSTVATDLTRSAELADLILFVWASSTHAVYRAFDRVKEKIQYVQGTGPASIILAAERWASLQLGRQGT